MINGGKKVEYGKDLKKIRFESNDDLAMNKPVKLHLLTIIIRSVFSEDGFFIHNFFQMMLCISQCKNVTIRKN